MSISHMVLSLDLRRVIAWLAAAGYAALLLAHPALYGQQSAYAVVAASLALAWVGGLAWQWPGWTALRPPRALLWPALVLALGAGLSVLVNNTSWGPLWQLAAQLFFLWLGWWLAADERTVRFLGGVLLLGGGLAGLYGVLQYLSLDPLPAATRFAGRILSSFDNPNHFANFMACLLPLGLAGFLRQAERRGLFCAWYTLVGLLYAGLVMAASRGAWGAGLAGSLVVLGGYARSLRLRQVPWRPLSLGLLFLLLLVLTYLLTLRPVLQGPVGPVSLGERALSSANIVGPGVQRDSTIQHRYFLWQVTWEMIQARPLSGLGYGSYQNRFATFRDAHRAEEQFQRLSWNQRREVTAYAHNEYLHLWAEAGVLGLLGFVLLILLGMELGLRKAWRAGQENLLLWGLLGSATAMLVDSLASYPLHLPLNGMVFWVLFGIIFGQKIHAYI